MVVASRDRTLADTAVIFSFYDQGGDAENIDCGCKKQLLRAEVRLKLSKVIIYSCTELASDVGTL